MDGNNMWMDPYYEMYFDKQSLCTTMNQSASQNE